MSDLMPAGYTEDEWKLIPSSYIHLKKGYTVIHKMPIAFLERTQKLKKYKQIFNEDTGENDVTEIVKTVKRDPACDLKAYKRDGWERCNRYGTEILNWDGTSKAKPKEKD